MPTSRTDISLPASGITSTLQVVNTSNSTTVVELLIRISITLAYATATEAKVSKPNKMSNMGVLNVVT